MYPFQCGRVIIARSNEWRMSPRIKIHIYVSLTAKIITHEKLTYLSDLNCFVFEADVRETAGPWDGHVSHQHCPGGHARAGDVMCHVRS